jgi:hypothetical protein
VGASDDEVARSFGAKTGVKTLRSESDVESHLMQHKRVRGNVMKDSSLGDALTTFFDSAACGREED